MNKKKTKKLFKNLVTLLLVITMFASSTPVGAQEITTNTNVAIDQIQDPVIREYAREFLAGNKNVKVTNLLNEPTSQSRTSGALNIALYQGRNFTVKAIPEGVYVGVDAELVSLYAISPDPTEILTAHIVSLDGNGVSLTLPFVADGTTTTWPQFIPAGNYRVFITGSPDTVKPYGSVLFSTTDYQNLDAENVETNDLTISEEIVPLQTEECVDMTNNNVVPFPTIVEVNKAA